jgi:hypothetical protein
VPLDAETVSQPLPSAVLTDAVQARLPAPAFLICNVCPGARLAGFFSKGEAAGDLVKVE